MNHNEAFFGQRGRGGKNQRGGRYNNFRGRGNGGGRGNVNNQNKLNSQPPPKQNKVTNQQEHEEEIICQICGKKNHSAVNCWYRYDYSDEEDTPKALAAMNLQDGNDPKFYADSGATSHMTNNKGNIDKPIPYEGNDKIFVGNGQGLHITHVGNASLNTDYGKLKLNNVLVVPKLKKNLLSVRQLIKDNKCSFEFNSDGFVVKNQANQVLARGLKKGNLYALEENKELTFAAIRGDAANSDVWHKRLGHPSPKVLHVLIRERKIDVSQWIKKSSLCISCQLGKHCKLRFSPINNKTTVFPLEKIHL